MNDIIMSTGKIQRVHEPLKECIRFFAAHARTLVHHDAKCQTNSRRLCDFDALHQKDNDEKSKHRLEPAHYWRCEKRYCTQFEATDMLSTQLLFAMASDEIAQKIQI